jgi:SAM-dependent methyltransferase
VRPHLAQPGTTDLDLDSDEATVKHREILQTKRVLRDVYTEIYRRMVELERRYITAHAGVRLEIGSGGGFLKEFLPDLVTTDIKHLPFVDCQSSAYALPFADRSVKTIFCRDVLHHLGDIRRFFREARRVLLLGGGIIACEPANTILSRFLYTTFHHEPFCPSVTEWEFAATGPSSGSNQALPWVVFHRDRPQFEREFPQLEFAHSEKHTWLRYVLSGGVTMRQMAPDFVFKPLRYVEGCLEWCLPWVALSETYVLRRRT